jgi:Tol biopolymer transport system component
MTSSRRSAREEWARSTGARDTRLHRDVALKVLPDAFAADPERLARFEREAQALAALNHPHIAAIHGVEENASTGAGQGTVRTLVLELVDGETLAERIARGPLPTDEAVRLARQIADALEAAHEQGVIHRDLKPANIKITPDGNVKVLDFGLAKLASVEPSLSGAASGLSMSPTMTSPALVTGAAVLLGTAGYMAPEQARGRTIDKRADIWAFGVVLYEMLTGRRAFDGDSVTEVAGAVIHKEPDWRALPAATPPTVRLVLERCLQKDPKQRFRDIGDVRLALDGALVAVPPPAAAAPARRRVRELAIVAALAALASGAAVWMATPGAPPASAVRFQISSPDRLELVPMIDVSPDGRVITFLVPSAEGPRIWLHSLDSGVARAVPGDHVTTRPTFWSPDGRYIGYWFDNSLRRVAMSGGPAEPLTQSRSFAGGSWGRGDVIVFAGDGGIHGVDGSGGTAVMVTTIDKSRNEDSHILPSFLPDGRHFLYLRTSTDPAVTGIYVGSIDVAPGQQDLTRLVATGQHAIYARGADDPDRGQLLFVRDGLLMAQPFDAARRLLAAAAVPAVDAPVLISNGSYGTFSASQNGTLVYLRNQTSTGTITIVDRNGRAEPVASAAKLDRPSNPRLSPDGRRLALIVAGDVWVHDLDGRPPIKLTFDGDNYSPIWSPDGQRIVFERGGAGSDGHSLYALPADGSGGEAEPVAPSGHFHAQTWSAEGELVVSRITGGTGDLLRVAARPDATPVPIQQTPANEGWSAAVSPDRRRIAYDANPTGRMEIWVRAAGRRRSDSDLTEQRLGAAVVEGRARAVLRRGRPDDGGAGERGRSVHVFHADTALHVTDLPRQPAAAVRPDGGRTLPDHQAGSGERPADRRRAELPGGLQVAGSR